VECTVFFIGLKDAVVVSDLNVEVVAFLPFERFHRCRSQSITRLHQLFFNLLVDPFKENKENKFG
jgi:hypothetical protein